MVPEGSVTPRGGSVEVVIETGRAVRVGKRKAVDVLDRVSTVLSDLVIFSF